MAPAALVTGASSGIGEAFAHALAQRHHDLVLVARRRDRLHRLATDLRSKYDTTSEVLAADLVDDASLTAVEQRVADRERPIDVIVNCAGAGVAGAFTDIELADHLDQLALNARAVLRLSHAAARAMLPRGRGAILNVASIGALVPAPRFATYAAAKAFVLSLTEALHEELKPSGIHVTCVCPGATRTEFGSRSGATADSVPSVAWQNADQVARTGLAALDRNQAVCVTGAVNKVISTLAGVAPRSAVRRVSALVASRL